MFVEYNNVLTPQNLLDIPDIGNIAIEASNDDGLYFYLVSICVRGQCYIATCGPCVPDITELPPGYTCQLQVIKFDRKKMIANLERWLNERKPGKSKAISSAKIICIEDALNQFRNVGEYFFENSDLACRIFNDFEGEVLEDE